MAKRKSIVATLKNAGVKKKIPSKKSLWRGPSIDGITQSMLSSFIMCKERFRLNVVEGLCLQDTFNKNMEYGSMWHICEEEYSRSREKDDEWAKALLAYIRKLCQRYPLQQSEIVKWYNVCKMQFEVYLKYWSKEKATPYRQIMEEHVFKVPYTLPSGREVNLRGMCDGIMLRGKGKNARLFLREHKTKGDIKEEQLRKQLQFDLQTMMYIVAMQVWFETDVNYNGDKIPFGGVLYNVVRRPLSGGKGSIRQHKPTKSNPQGENLISYYDRLRGIIEEEADTFFMRWTVTITPSDIEKFKHTFLNPILEHLCDWWAWIKPDPFNPFRQGNTIHHRTPYGMYNVLAEGGTTDIDAYLQTGNRVGLVKRTKLFNELEGK